MKAEKRTRTIGERLANYYTPTEARRWMDSPHPQLNGERPTDLVMRHEFEPVHAILDRLDSDAYL